MMMPRADHLLARAWERARQQILPSEGFLEDALAAALEHPAAWPRLVEHFGWGDRLPHATPTISTQRADTWGRTDIELAWRDRDSPIVVFELKVQAPPTSEQISRYLARENNVLIGIGAWSNAAALRADLPIAHVDRLIDVVTWNQLRHLTWRDAPLEIRQFQHLLDAIGVAVPRTDEQQLVGLTTALPLLPLLDSWILAGLAEARDVCIGVELGVARPIPPRFDNGWYAGYLKGSSPLPTELTI
jgi:hypothetical protein